MDYKRAAYTLRMMKRTAFPSADEREAIDFAVQALETLAQEKVPYETAKTLKEKGCPQDTDYYWMVRGKEEPHGVTLHDKLDYEDDWGVGFATFIPAPTYHEAVDWLEGKRCTGLELL